MSLTNLPDVHQWLCYEDRFIDPAEPRGLWFCANPLDVSAIQINAVCLAGTLSGSAKWDALDRCREFIRQFPYLLIVCPDEEQRKEMVQQLRRRIDIPILVTESRSFLSCSSVSALRDAHGLRAVDQLLLNTYELPAYGLLNLKDVEPPNLLHLPKVTSGIPELDRTTGGFFLGDLSVWTGRRGSGKSTLLGQLLLEAIDQGQTVCAYSGELPAWRFKYWTQLQAAGLEHLEFHTDPATGRRVPSVPSPVAGLIDAWWDKRFFLDDLDAEGAHDEGQILRNFEYAVRRYGANVFLVDNIMTARFHTNRDADYYRSQANFVGRLKAFAKRHNAHVHVVAHPRKGDKSKGGKEPDADDVGGSGDVTNLADNVFALGEGLEPGKSGTAEKVPGLKVLKNRAFGDKKTIPLGFERHSKRFYPYRGGRPDKRYSWDLPGQQFSLLPGSPPEEGDPFEAKGDAT